MCRFRSGIILKTRVIVAQGADDSHTNLLEELGIEDTRENAMRKFVRVELIPPNDEWWTDPDTWEPNVDQDILPEWFETDRERYIEEFRSAVKDWWNSHVFVDKKIDELTSGYYRLKRCEVKCILKDVQLMLDNSTVQEMWDNSTVQKMLGNSTVQEMWGNSTVQEMLDNSTVQEMWDNSTVQKMLGNSTVQEMWDNSTVQEMLGNSTVQKMLDNSTVQEMLGNSTVQEMLGNSTVQKMLGNSTVQEMWDNSTVQKMLGNSTVQKMLGNSTVQEMWDNSIARDNAHGVIRISSETRLNTVVHENEEVSNE